MANVTEHLPGVCRVAVVQGAGLLGLHGCALLREAGVGRVMVVDTDEERLARVAEFGGEAVLSEDVRAKSADLVIEAAGVPSVVRDGLRMLRPGGHYHFVGMVHPESELGITGEAIVRGCVVLRGFHNYAPRHLERAVAFLKQSTLPWGELVSPPVPLRRLEEGFALSATRRWARVAVSMQG
jgi:threonine dehydrogenase-like Zn-dependent dehydrogenase